MLNWAGLPTITRAICVSKQPLTFKIKNCLNSRRSMWCLFLRFVIFCILRTFLVFVHKCLRTCSGRKRDNYRSPRAVLFWCSAERWAHQGKALTTVLSFAMTSDVLNKTHTLLEVAQTCLCAPARGSNCRTFCAQNKLLRNKPSRLFRKLNRNRVHIRCLSPEKPQAIHPELCNRNINKNNNREYFIYMNLKALTFVN